MTKTIDKKVEKEDIFLVKSIIKDFFKHFPKKQKCLSKNSPTYIKLVNHIPYHYFNQTNGKILNSSYIDVSLKEMGYKLGE